MAVGVHFAEQLGKQFSLLEASCRQYDAGDHDQALCIADAVRTIFHTTGASTSLLTHLRATHINLLSTCGKRPSDDPSGYWPGFVQIVAGVGQVTLQCLPNLSSRPAVHRMVPFASWWGGEVVYYGGGRRYKRKNFILSSAGEEGQHVDATLPPEYEWMLEGAGFSFSVDRANGIKSESRLPNPHLACLRQIAHEVFQSPELLKLAGK
jgi:hypothetical protein